jgi:ATP-dependent protease ClpP protease subunit
MNIPADLMSGVWAHLRNRDTRPRPNPAEGRGRVKVTNHATGPEMWIYDEIGYWGITASDVVAELSALGSAATLTVHMNTPGGDVFDGIAIYNALADHPATVTVVVDSLAASAGSFIAMAGDTVRMNRSSQMMIHDASGLCIGNSADMAEMQTMLDRISDTIASMYAARAGGDTASWRGLMQAETWYSADEAVAAGLADETATEQADADPEAALVAAFDLTCFHYAGRDESPGPVPVAAAVEPEPEAETPPPVVFDTDQFRAAMASPPQPTFDTDLFRTEMEAAAR